MWESCGRISRPWTFRGDRKELAKVARCPRKALQQFLGSRSVSCTREDSTPHELAWAEESMVFTVTQRFRVAISDHRFVSCSSLSLALESPAMIVTSRMLSWVAFERLELRISTKILIYETDLRRSWIARLEESTSECKRRAQLAGRSSSVSHIGILCSVEMTGQRR